LFLAWPAISVAAPPKKTTPKKSATAKKSTSRKSAGVSQKKRSSTRSTAASSKKSPKKGATRASTRSWRNTQQTPTRERYAEIQQALAGKGFFRAEPNGSWGPESTQALRDFQRANNLKETGKIDSLSLFALGLGPKRTAVLKPSSEQEPLKPTEQEPKTQQP
jgi:peptidoglycan hydrolase-like protein with peptidoglycan-binding domain